MPRQLLPHDVSSEDRQRGCFWASTFRRPGDEVEKLGTINGTPVINRGVTLDGAADYLLYDLWGQFALADSWSCHMLFWPDFATDADAAYTFFNVTGGGYTIWKRPNANANVLRLSLGGINIADVAEATYTGLWVVRGRNLITVSGTTGATDVWLNGTQIVTADVTAWTPTDPAQLSVGANVAGAALFDGRIEALHIYNTLLTELDHDAIWAGGGA